MDNRDAIDRISGALRFFAYRRSTQTGTLEILQESAASMLGDLPDHLDRFFELVHPDDRGSLETAVRKLKPGGRYVFDYRLRARGATRWFRDSGIMTENSDDVCFQEGLLFDITDWPFPRLAIGQAASSVLGLESAIPDLWFVIDSSGMFLEYKPSPQLAPLFPPDQFIGRHLEEVLPPSVTAQAREKIKAALSTGEVQSFEYSLSRGSEEWYEGRIAPLPFDRVLCVVRDITDRVTAQQEARARTGMLAGLAGCAKILLGKSSDENVRDYISELGRSTNAQRVCVVRGGPGLEERSIPFCWQATSENTPTAQPIDWSLLCHEEAKGRLSEHEIVVLGMPPVGIAPILVGRQSWGLIVVQWPPEQDSLRGDLRGVLEIAASHLGTYLERQEALAEHAGLFNALNDSENAIVVTDDAPTAQILHANEAFRKLISTLARTPSTLQEALQYPVTSLAGTLSSEPTGGSGQSVFIQPLKRWFQITRSRIGESSQAARRYVWVLTDITERKEAERAFFSGLLKEQELNDRKTRLITNISHQFFTPLSVILSSAELIQHLGDKCTPEKRGQLLTRITQAVEQLTGKMHSHLQLEQRPLGERDTFSDGVDLSRTLIRVIDDLSLGDKRWNTVVPRILGRGRLVRTSERLVRQLMLELLRNAGTYGGEFAGIQIDLDLDQEPVRFSVRDHGPGLPPAESLPAVHRLSTSHGFGLGLAIVRECCQQLSGSFEIGNCPDGGLLAIATLPDASRNAESNRT